MYVVEAVKDLQSNHTLKPCIESSIPNDNISNETPWNCSDVQSRNVIVASVIGFDDRETS